MRKTPGSKIVIPSQTTSAIPIVNPEGETTTKVVLKNPVKGITSTKKNLLMTGFQ